MTAIPVASARSTFVTVVGWLFLLLGALATLGSLTGVLVLAATPAATIDAIVSHVAQDSASTHLLPGFFRVILHHPYLVSLMRLVWWAAVVIVSIGVLRRKEWARRSFVAVLGIAIVGVIITLVVGLSIGMSLAALIASRTPTRQVPAGMGTGFALASFLEIGVAALLLWLLFKFRSASVREEFGSTTRAA